MSSSPATQPRRSLPFWLLLLVVWVIVGLSMGRTQSMGLYLAPVTGALGVGREAFGLSMALAQLGVGIAAPLTGGLIDRYGAGPIVALGLIVSMSGLWLLHEAHDGPSLLLAGALLGLGVSATGVTSLVGTIGRAATPERRLSAIASVGMAAGIGGFVALPLMHLLIEWAGWRPSLVWLITVTGLLIPLALTLGGASPASPTATREQTAGEALREAFRHPSFWLLTGGFFVCGFHVAFIMVHLPAFALDKGLAAWVGPVALSAIGIANIVGTWLAGRSGGWIEKRRGLSLIYLGRAVMFCGFLLLPMTPTTLIVLCALLGLLWLATIPLTSGLVATFFGTTWMSMLFGIVFLSHQIGSFLGVWLAGRLFDLLRSYDAMWWISIALGITAALMHWPIQERPVARLQRAQFPG